MGEEQERIPSYVILDKIDHEIFMAIQNRDVMDCVSDATNNIVALIAEALLSEQAVEAAAKAAHSTEHLLMGAWSIDDLHESQRLNGPRVMDEEQREGYRYAARLSNKAALQAVGITGAGQEGGQGE